MNLNYCQLAIIIITLGSLLACGSKNTDDFCTNHNAIHSEHLDKVIQVSVDYSASTHLTASISVPKDLTSRSNHSALRDSPSVFRLDSAKECQHDPVGSTEKNARIVYQYHIDCGEGNDIDRIETELLNLIPDASELDVSITSPAVTKEFIIHRDCSSPIYTYR